MKTIVIGDIHGCYKALKALLEKLGIWTDGAEDPGDADRADASADIDRLILLGDLFDRGPQSWEVFLAVQSLQERFGDRFVLLRGNHEDYLLQENLPFRMKLVWERVGRKTTVQSFKQHGMKMEEAAPWLREHSVLFWRGEGIQCVHAGLKSAPPEANDNYTMLHDHGIVLLNRYNGPLTIVGHIALDKPAWFAGDGETVKVLEEGVSYPLPDIGTICIDTGCGKGGRLIGMVIENGQFILHGVAERGNIN